MEWIANNNSSSFANGELAGLKVEERKQHSILKLIDHKLPD